MTGWIGLGEVWCTDDVAAVAVWIRRILPRSSSSRTRRAANAGGSSRTVRSVRCGEGGTHPAEPHWYLQLLATHPDWQRQGLAAALMNVVFERAETDGLPCWLETETVENVAYYRHHGFEVHAEWDLARGPHVWGMYRPT